MTNEQQIHLFDDVVRVLGNEDRFKLKLGAGRNTFASIKAGDLIGRLVQVSSAAGAGAGAAFAATAPSSTVWGALLVSFGMTSNPIGWIVGAAAASGGVYYGVSHLFKTYSSTRVDEVPRFLNTGLDVLASTTLDLLGSLSLEIAAIDGHIDASERVAMEEYFVEEWGYDPDYVTHALDVLQQNVDKSLLSEMATSLASFAHENPDCNFPLIQAELRKLLTEIAEADGYLDEREEMAIERIECALRERNTIISSTIRAISEAATGVRNTTTSTAQTVGKTTSTALFGAADMAVRARKVTASYISAKIWPRG
ncbi:TerB family tellurite resistance protein [Primorskyibacter aestuariivivens]|nr:TerB family tellurite resistance protein [Primorskyibacter aestuariivivens]MDA7430151.1 TerB family tellurite resistance protein [Primorskyibacter aestuariivivens]